MIALAIALTCTPRAARASQASTSSTNCTHATPGAPADQRIAEMLCLINKARRQHGLRPLAILGSLVSGATSKASDIARCHQFTHTACGKRADEDSVAAGYRGPFAENLFLGNGVYATSRAALRGWLQSPPHRRNLLRPDWRTVGIAIKHGTMAHLETHGTIRGTTWVIQFGT